VAEDRYDVPVAPTGFTENFAGAVLDARWISPGGPATAFTVIGADEGLSLKPAVGSPAGLLGLRTHDEHWEADVVVIEGDVALMVRMDDFHTVVVAAGQDRIDASATIGGLPIALGSAERSAGAVVLRIRTTPPADVSGFRNGPDLLRLGVVGNDVFTELGSIDGRYTATEVAGGFTGRVVGVSPGPRGGTITGFTYRPRTA
jgi:xylan 1,4-beta-xylosidase